MSQTEGARLFREAWIAGVRRHFPGEPKPGYVADRPDPPTWQAEWRDALDPGEPRTRAQFPFRAATARMRAGDVDSGCATAQDVLTVAAGVRSARLDDHLRTMLTEASTVSDTSAVRELLDQGRAVLNSRAVA